jgi:hypothetical protein
VRGYRVVSEAPGDDVESFPRTLAGLWDALGRAAWLSVGGAPRLVMADDRVIRRFEGGQGVLRAGPVPAKAGGLRVAVRR